MDLNSTDEPDQQNDINEKIMDKNGKMEEAKPYPECSFNDIFDNIGEFGKNQIIVLILLSLLVIPTVYQFYAIVFTTQDQSWQCSQNGVLKNECLLNGTFDVGDDLYHARCRMNRSSWEYLVPTSYFVTTEFDLICEKELWVTYVFSIPLLFAVFGSIILGILSGRYGRKPVIFVCYSVMIVGSFGQSFSPNYAVFFCFQVATNLFHNSIIPLLFVTAAEIVGTKYRAFASSLTFITFAISPCLLGLQAYLVKPWRLRSIILTIPYLLFLLFWKWVPETPRWLLAHGKYVEAEKELRKIAKQNKKEFPHVKLVEPPNCQGSLLDVFTNSRLRKMFLLHAVIWFINAIIYDGIILSTSYLSGRFYLDFILVSIVEIPANFAVIYGCNRFGRKTTAIWGEFLSFLFLTVVACLPEDSTNSAYSIPRACFGVLAKFTISIAFNSSYLLSAESFPTVVRSQAMVSLVILILVGAATAPWVAFASRFLHTNLPYIVLSVLCFVNLILCFLLKETKGLDMADTIDEERNKQQVEDLERLMKENNTIEADTTVA